MTLPLRVRHVYTHRSYTLIALLISPDDVVVGVLIRDEDGLIVTDSIDSQYEVVPE